MKVTAEGILIEGVLKYDKDSFRADLRRLKDQPVMIIIDTDYDKKTRKQRGYYWSVLVPHTLIILRDQCGMIEYKTNEDAHTFLKYRHNPIFVPDPKTGEMIRLPGSTKGMKKQKAKNYIDSIILEGWDLFNYTYPPPRKGQEKYFL